LCSWLVHLQKIAKATMASSTPSNGLDTANQKEASQPESWAVRFVFTLLSQASEDRHFKILRVPAPALFGASPISLDAGNQGEWY
jgi:hypothetical protein